MAVLGKAGIAVARSAFTKLFTVKSPICITESCSVRCHPLLCPWSLRIGLAMAGVFRFAGFSSDVGSSRAGR